MGVGPPVFGALGGLQGLHILIFAGVWRVAPSFRMGGGCSVAGRAGRMRAVTDRGGTISGGRNSVSCSVSMGEDGRLVSTRICSGPSSAMAARWFRKEDPSFRILRCLSAMRESRAWSFRTTWYIGSNFFWTWSRLMRTGTSVRRVEKEWEATGSVWM